MYANTKNITPITFNITFDKSKLDYGLTYSGKGISPSFIVPIKYFGGSLLAWSLC